MKKSCKPSNSSKNLPKQEKPIPEGCMDEHYMALAYLWDTADLTVPWDWRKSHMEEIEARSKEKSKKKGP